MHISCLGQCQLFLFFAAAPAMKTWWIAKTVMTRVPLRWLTRMWWGVIGRCRTDHFKSLFHVGWTGCGLLWFCLTVMFFKSTLYWHLLMILFECFAITWNALTKEKLGQKRLYANNHHCKIATAEQKLIPVTYKPLPVKSTGLFFKMRCVRVYVHACVHVYLCARHFTALAARQYTSLFALS